MYITKLFYLYFLLPLLLDISLYIASTTGECNVCSVFNNLACVSRTYFQVCINGLPSGPLNSCPTGYVCSTADATICQPDLGNVVIACDSCNKCDATNTFACTSVRNFALCLGSGVPTDITGSCAPYHVCNIDYTKICGNATMGIQATCSAYDDTPSTVAPTEALPNANKPVKYCQTVQQNGRFPVGIDISTTCRQYLYCVLNNNVWTGGLYTCPGRTYFNSSSRLCQVNVPARCLGTVYSLQLQNAAVNLYDFS